MSINLIQFQQGLSMVEFMQQYGTEAKAYRPIPSNPALRSVRWTPSVAGFYHLSILDANGKLVKRALRAVPKISAANVEWGNTTTVQK